MGMEKMWTVDELAEFAGVSVTTLYHWRWEGKGPKAIKVGRFLRYPEANIQKWLEVLGRGGLSVGRHPMRLGTWGRIRAYPMVFNAKGKPVSWRATTLVRGADGRTRAVERRGRSATDAENRLKAH